jgi:hypothetical protein
MDSVRYEVEAMDADSLLAWLHQVFAPPSPTTALTTASMSSTGSCPSSSSAAWTESTSWYVCMYVSHSYMVYPHVLMTVQSLDKSDLKALGVSKPSRT